MRKDREKELVSHLTDPSALGEVLYQLAPEEVDALRFLLDRCGVCKVVLLTRRFGADSDDPYIWTEFPPASVLGQLRLRGLVFVGRMVHGRQNCRTAVIPVELRQPLAGVLDGFVSGEIDPDALLRSAHRTADSWCDGAFPIPDDPEFVDEDREVLEDIVHSVVGLMATYQGELPCEWTAPALMECLTEDVPRKISADEDYFALIPDAIVTVLEYAGDSGELRTGRDLARLVASQAREIRRAARDPMRWGMAKTLVMAAQAEGVDHTDRLAMEEFFDRWNECAAPPAEPRRSTKVGRNQPCPCGSSKKYKRCCGR
jgi:hypothetical protein